MVSTLYLLGCRACVGLPTDILGEASRKIAEVPEWPYLCTREIELAKANRMNSLKLARQALIDKLGFLPAFDATMLEQSEIWARLAAEGRAFLDTLSSDSEDDVQTKNGNNMPPRK